jgi:hypothetical protein
MVTPKVSRSRLWTAAVLATVVVGGVAALLAFPLGEPVAATRTDTLATDSNLVSTDSVPLVVPPVTESLPPGKTTSPGRSTTPTPGPRATVGAIAVSAPPDAQISIRDEDIGFGQSRRDSLSPGPYLVRAVLPAIDGCTSNRDSTTVNVVAGRVTPVRLAPRLCGTIVIKASGRDSRNQVVPRELWYTLQPEGSAEPREQSLPADGLTRIVPVGKYFLHVRMAQCTPYDEREAFEVFAGETISRQSIVLICP